MPVLEVETVCRGLTPHLTGQIVTGRCAAKGSLAQQRYERDWRRQRNIELFTFLSVQSWVAEFACNRCWC